MTVIQLYPKQSPVPGIDCPKCQSCAGSQRCQYCFGDRACALATEPAAACPRGAELRVVEDDAQAGAPRSSRVGWLQRRSHGLPYWQGAPAQGAGMSGSVPVAVANFFSQRFQALRQRHAFFFRATCPVFGFERLITG